MPIPNEIPRQDQDASAGVDTYYCFVPNADGSYGRSNSAFRGELTAAYKDKEDWVIIELQAGVTYTFTLHGEERDTNGDGVIDLGETETEALDRGPLADPVLALYDSKGELIETNDDIGLNPYDLPIKDSILTITPDVSGIYYVSAGAYRGNPNRDDYGTYVLRVQELAPDNEINGTPNDDKLTGTDSSRPDVINGDEGKDSLYGGGGDDVLNGGMGSDLLMGGPGADELNGGEDRDGNDRDTISYKSSAEGVTINLLTGSARGGDAEGDTFETDIEDVQGSMHDDRLSGDNKANWLMGLDGNDMLYGDNGKDTLSGGAGDDELDGGDGDDSLTGGPGADELTGGDGDDTASYARSAAGVTVRLHAFQAMGGDAKGDTFGDTVIYPWTDYDEDDEPVEMEATLPDIINLSGSNHDDILAGDHRANTISGGRGDDKLYGGPSGDDTNIDLLSGGRGDDMLFGGAGGDTLDGGKGDDMLWGGPGEDTLVGGFGSDTFYITFEEGVAQPDTVYGDGVMYDDDGMITIPIEAVVDPNPYSKDTVSFEKWVDEEENTGVTLNIGADAVTVDDVSIAPTVGIINIENIIGSSDEDILIGDAGNNTIEGGEGDDVLDGGGNTAGGDTVSYRSSDRGVRVDLSDDTPGDRGSRGDAAGDTISNFENIIGSAHDDDLRGTNGTEDFGMFGSTIEGLAGADVLDGGDVDTNGDQTLTDLNALLSSQADGANDRSDTLSYRSSSAGVTVNLVTASASGGDATGDEIETFDVDYDHDDDEMIQNPEQPDDPTRAHS